MAMTKAEMESHQGKYDALMAGARTAQRKGLYRQAVELALSSWEYIDGMMQYERKYEDKEFDSIESIDMVLKYAPFLFDFQSLDTLESLLNSKRRIEKNTAADLGDKLAQARALMWDVHRMWDHLEQHPDVRQDELRQVLGGNQDKWRSMAEMWEKMGLIHRTPEGGSYRVKLSTRLGEVISAKCPSCGSLADAPKGMLLEELACPECKETILFIFLLKESTPSTEE